MADNTKIEWADATWPVVQGCDYASPGCTNCYAVPLIWRHMHHPDPKISGPLQGLVEKHANGKLAWTGKVALREDRLDWPLNWKGGKRIFIPSHGDLFHPAVPRDFQDRVFARITFCGAATPGDAFILLTKRPDALADYLIELFATGRKLPLGPPGSDDGIVVKGPIKGLWGLTSVERQQEADERIPHILRAPLAVRGISAEPLLGPIDLLHVEGDQGTLNTVSGYYIDGIDRIENPRLDWVVVGGESGPGARPMHPAWARSLRDQCAAAGVPFFFKQHGSWVADSLLENPRTRGLIMRLDGSRPSDADLSAMMAGTFDYSGYQHFSRVGKRAAGRLLDGKEHSEFPP